MSVGSTEQYINKLVQISRFLKGSTSIPELDNMSVQKVHCIYKIYIDYNIERNKAMEEQDRENNKQSNQNNNLNSGGIGFGEEFEEMMEDMM